MRGKNITFLLFVFIASYLVSGSFSKIFAAECAQWSDPVCLRWGQVVACGCDCGGYKYVPAYDANGVYQGDVRVCADSVCHYTCDYSKQCELYGSYCVSGSVTCGDVTSCISGDIIVCGRTQYACNSSTGCCNVGTGEAAPAGGGCSYACQTGGCTESQKGADACGVCPSGESCCGDASACNTCTSSAPDAPVAISPATIDNYTEKTGIATLTWTAVTDWGKECSKGNVRGYQVCIGPDASDPCNGGQSIFVPGETTTNVNAYGMDSAINYWKVRAKNKANKYSSWSSMNNFCFYGFNSRDPLAVTTWSVCDPTTHVRTRQCIEGCDCTGIRMSETCEAYIRGTIFDASFLNTCPADTNGDGYADESLTPDQYARDESFSISDEDNSPPVGTPSGTYAITTTETGNYQARVYAGGDASASGLPVRYAYDFSGMAYDFDLAVGPKLLCNNSSEAVASAWSNDQLCLYQPCTIVDNQNFGFWRIFGGWWQVTGGSVYGAGGVRSYIPPSTVTNPVPQQLILADGNDNGRTGLLAYGEKNSDELGYNPNARVSSSLWEIQSLYQGLRYDYNYYNTRMSLFASTTWDGGEISYNDKGVGFQIFKHTGDVTVTGLSLTGTQKVILLVNGNVTVSGDLITPNGAFLAIIAKGDITFTPDMSKAQGWFVAERISVPCRDAAEPYETCDRDDTRFLGEGSFVGWTNIYLRRDRGLTNNAESSEQFIYRPDFFINAPTPMRVYTRKFTPFIP